MRKIIWITLIFFDYIATAHIMPAGRGTINIIEKRAYVAISLPQKAFMDIAEKPRKKSEIANISDAMIRERFTRRVHLRSGAA